MRFNQFDTESTRRESKGAAALARHPDFNWVLSVRYPNGQTRVKAFTSFGRILNHCDALRLRIVSTDSTHREVHAE